MSFLRRFDWVLFIVMLLIIGIGFVMINSAYQLPSEIQTMTGEIASCCDRYCLLA